jgi:hypothetical protein
LWSEDSSECGSPDSAAAVIAEYRAVARIDRVWRGGTVQIQQPPPPPPSAPGEGGSRLSVQNVVRYGGHALKTSVGQGLAASVSPRNGRVKAGGSSLPRFSTGP